MSATMPESTFRHARAEDAAPIWHLLGEVGSLERNSCYAYVLLCTHFSGTSMVAESRRGIDAFVLAYVPPDQPDDLFVWQIGVAPAARKAGLGGKLLDGLLAATARRGVRYLTATVSPDNIPSQNLFSAFARRHRVPSHIETGFRAALFANAHEDERLWRIGPLPFSSMTRKGSR